MPIYNLNGDTYNIPDDIVEQFEKDNPDATIQYSADGDDYDIPVSEKAGFLQAFPEAKYRDLNKSSEQKSNEIPQPTDAMGNVITNNGQPYSQEVLAAYNSPENTGENYKDLATLAASMQPQTKPSDKPHPQQEKPFMSKRNPAPFTAQQPSPLKPEEYKMPMMFKDKAEELKQMSQSPDLTQHVASRAAEEQRRVTSPGDFAYKVQGMQEAQEAEGARKMNRSQFDSQNFDKFYNEHVDPIFAEERQAGEQRTKEAVKDIPKYDIPGAQSGFARMFESSVAEAKNQDPEKIANQTLKRVQDDDSFGDYIMQRMGISGSDGNDGDTPQLSDREKDWMKRLFAKETAEVAAQIEGRIYDKYKQENAPTSTLEYIGGKAFHENLMAQLYDAMVRRAAGSSGMRQQLRAMAYDEFGKDQDWATRVAGGAAPFAVDMLTGGFAVPNLVGSAVTKGTMKLAAKQLVKEMSNRAAARGLEGVALKAAVKGGEEAAERYIATQAPILNIAMRTAGSAANFATYDVQAELVRQMANGEFKPWDLMKEAAHGAVLGSALGAVGGSIGHVARNASTIGKLGAGAAGVAAEIGLFAASAGLQKAIEDGVDIQDVDWADTTGEALGTVIGMKAVGAAMHPREFLNRYRKSKDYDLQFNKHDLDELKAAGYDFDGIFKGLGKFGEVNPMEGKTISKAKEVAIGKAGKDAEAEEAWVDREAFDNILHNPEVSSSAKRKLVYLATGKILTPEPMFGVTMDVNENGKATVTTTNAYGNPIETKDFKSEEEAKKEYDKLQDESRTNTIGALERIAQKAGFPDVLDIAKGRTKNEKGVDVDDLEQLAGLDESARKEVFDAYIKNLQDAYTERFNENLERISQQAEENKGEQPSLQGTTPPPAGGAGEAEGFGGENEGITPPPVGATEGTEAEGTVPTRSERRDAAYNRGVSVSDDNTQLPQIGYDNRLATARLMVQMPDSDPMLSSIRSNIMEAVMNDNDEEADRIIADANLTPLQQEAVEQWRDAVETHRGIDEAVIAEAEKYEQQHREGLQTFADAQGNIIPLQLNDGTTVYYKSGDLNNHYGGVIVVDENGQSRQIPVRSITNVGEPENLEEAIRLDVESYVDNLQNYYKDLSEGVAFNEGQQVEMVVGGQPVVATYSRGDAFGNPVFQFEDGSEIMMRPDEAQQAIAAAESAKIQQTLAAEKESARLADMQQRFTDGIKGYAEGTPDLSAPETDAKAAADYLMEQTQGDNRVRKQQVTELQNTKDQLKQKMEDGKAQLKQLQQWLAGNEDIADPAEVQRTKDMITGLEAAIADIDKRQQKLGEIRRNMMTNEELAQMEQQRRSDIFKARSGYQPQLPQRSLTTSEDRITLEDGKPDFGLTPVSNANNYLLKNFEDSIEAEKFVTEQRLALRDKQRDEIQPAINSRQEILNQYAAGVVELTPDELKQLTHEVADLESYQDALSQEAVRLREIAEGIPALYERNGREQELTPAEQRGKLLDKATNREDKLRIARDIYNMYPQALDVINDQEPRDIAEYISQNLGLKSINWEGRDIGGRHIRGLQEELGSGWQRGIGKDYATNAFNMYLAPEGEGKGVEEIIHGLYEAQPDMGDGKLYTTEDLRNGLIDLLQTAQRPSEISHRLIDNRIAEAEAIVQREEDFEREMEEQAKSEEMQQWADFYHLNPEEREAFEEFMKEPPSEIEQEVINQIIAENEQDRRSQEMAPVNTSGATGREGEGGEGQVQGPSSAAAAPGNQKQQDVIIGKEAPAGEPPVSDTDVPGGTQVSLSETPRAKEVKNTIAEYQKKYYSNKIGYAELDMPDMDLLEACQLFDGIVETAKRHTPEDVKQIADNLRQYVINNKIFSIFDPATKKIVIFASRVPEGREREMFFHENLHSVLNFFYGGTKPMIAERFWKDAPDEGGRVTKEFIQKKYTQPEWAEELFVTWMAKSMDEGNLDDMRQYLTDEGDQTRLNAILKEINYVEGEEVNGRDQETALGERNDGAGDRKASLPTGADRGAGTESSSGQLLPEVPEGNGSDGNTVGGLNDAEKSFISDLKTLLNDYDTGDNGYLTDRDLIEEARSLADDNLPQDSEIAKRINDALDEYDDTQQAYLYENGMRDDDGSEAMIETLREIAAIKPKATEEPKDESFPARLAEAKAETNINPTEAQKKAGNYKMGHISFGGYQMSIENPKGSTRSGVDKQGNPWSIQMQDSYGYIGKKYGTDGDHMDFFINDDADLDNFNGRVYVVDQTNPDGSFDEHKVMYGYPTWAAARKAYERNYEKGWWDSHVKQMIGVKKVDFDKWLAESDHKTKPFGDYYTTKMLKDVVKDNVDQTLADILDREEAAKNMPVTPKWSDQELAGMESERLAQLRKKAKYDHSTSNVLLATTNGGEVKKRILRENMAQAEADMQAIDKEIERRRRLIIDEIDNREIGGAMVDHLQDMGVAVSNDPSINRKALKQAQKDKSKNGKLRKMSTSSGTVYGFAYKGKLYLDPRRINGNLPLHEYGHLWCEAFRKLNPEGWKDIVSLMKQDPDTWNFIKQLYSELTSDNDIAEEMITRGSGDRGEGRIRQEFERMSQKDPSYKGKWGNIWKNISKAIQDFWKKVGDFLHIKYESAEQVYDQVLKDFAEGVNPRKKVEQWLQARDKEYEKAVKDGDTKKAVQLFNEALKENVGNGMTPFVAVDKYYPHMQAVAHKIKDGDTKGIEKAADMMAPLIPEDAVLIPTPSHTGKATTMLDLANAIAKRTGSEVADILSGKPRQRQYDVKLQGGKPLTPQDMGITVNGELPEGKIPVVIDNVVNTGNTAEACIQALGTGIVASLADSQGKVRRVSSLTSAAPIAYDKQGKLIPLSKRFDMARPMFYKPDPMDEVMDEVEGRKELSAAIEDYNEQQPTPVEKQVRERATKAVLMSLDKANVPVNEVSQKEADQMMEIFAMVNQQAIVGYARSMRPDAMKRYAVINLRDPYAVPKYFEKQKYANDYKVWANRNGGQYRMVDIGYEDELQQTDGLTEAASIMPEINVWHGSGAVFTKFDHSHMGEGQGSQAFGWGTYLTDSRTIGTDYARLNNLGWEYKGKTRHEYPVGKNFKTDAIRDILLNLDLNEHPKVAIGKVRNFYQSAIRDYEDNMQDLSEADKEDLKDMKSTLKFINSLKPEDFAENKKNLYKVEIPSRDESYFIGYKEKMGDQKDILEMVDNALAADGWRRQEIDTRTKFTKGNKQIILTPNQSGADLYAELEEALGSDKAASQFLHNTGVTGVMYPAGSIFGGGENATNYVIFDENDAKIVEHIQFMFDDGATRADSQPIFYSNAMKAVEAIKQEKATPDQWLAMLQKNGGLKAGEDKWIGLSDYLEYAKKTGGTVSKGELLDFIRDNQIEVEETHYMDEAKRAEMALEKKYPGFKDAFYLNVYPDGDADITIFDNKKAIEFYNKYNEDEQIDPENYDKYDLGAVSEWAMDMYTMTPMPDDIKHADSIRENYSTNGLSNYHEIALTVPTIEPYKEDDRLHFGDAGGGRAVAWIRFGDAELHDPKIRKALDDASEELYGYLDRMSEKYHTNPDEPEQIEEKRTPEEKAEHERIMAKIHEMDAADNANTKKVLVIDEIQSKRHQEGREEGYERHFDISGVHTGEYVKAKGEYADRISFADVIDSNDIPIGQIEKIDDKYRPLDSQGQRIGFKDYDTEDEAMDVVANDYTRIEGVPDAPFEKNWHELAMKRMLRYAAENGYDKIAWTTGDQQAERYNIGGIVPNIDVTTNPGDEYFYKDLRFSANGNGCRICADENGKIKISEGLGDGVEGKSLGEVFGKDVAAQIMNTDTPHRRIQLEGKRIGGEGMKGFYDEILPRFMNKYGKKWGIKVDKLDMPDEIFNKKYGEPLSMWSIDVTPEMRESVMQGQPMFQKGKQGEVYGWTDGQQIYLTPKGMNPNSPIHEYTHIWDLYVQKEDPKLWKEMVDTFKKTQMWQQIRENPNYRNIWDDDDRMASEVHSRLSGAMSEEEFMKAAAADKDADSENLINKVKDVLRRFWETIAKLFGKHVGDRLDEFVRMPLRDLLRGFNPSGDKRDIMAEKGKIVEKTMMGVHNISEEKLKKALKQGGLANPSLAVFDTKNYAHTDYGEISLIPRSSLIDSRTGRNAGTYSGDAWTPTYPGVSRFLTKKGDKHRLQIAKEAANGNAEMERHLAGVINDWVEGNGDRMHFLFLKQKGLNPEVRPERTTHSHEEFEEVQKIFGEGTVTMPSDFTKEQSDALLDLMTRGYEEQIRKQAETIKDESKREAAINVMLKRKLDGLVDEDGKIWFAKGDNFVYDNWRDEQRRKNPQPDWYGTDNDASYRVAKEGLSEEYEKWKENLLGDEDIEERLFAGWTPDGNKRYVANTVQNASRIMNKEAETNAYGNGGVNASKAGLLKKLRSLSEIRKYRHLLKNEDQIKEQAEKASDEWFDIINQVSDMQKIDSNPYINIDIAEARLQEAMTMRDPISYLNKEYGYHISKNSELATDLTNFIDKAKEMPVKYFETKFKRPVGIDEFAVAVVPTTTSPEVVKALQEAGLEIHTYEKGDTGDAKDENRIKAVMDAVNQRNDILFDIETPMVGEAKIVSMTRSNKYGLNEQYGIGKRLTELKDNNKNTIAGYSDPEKGEIVILGDDADMLSDKVRVKGSVLTNENGMRALRIKDKDFDMYTPKLVKDGYKFAIVDKQDGDFDTVKPQPEEQKPHPKVTSLIQTELFSDKDFEPQAQAPVEKKKDIAKMSDEELLKNIANTDDVERRQYIEEYDMRHAEELDKLTKQYADMLTDDNTNLDELYNMYDSVFRRFTDEAYSTADRTRLLAQIHAIEDHVEYLEEQEQERQMEEDELQQEEQSQQANIFEMQKHDLQKSGVDLTQMKLRKLEPGEECHVERRYQEYGVFSFTGKDRIESIDDVAYIFKQLEDAAVENSFLVLEKDGIPTIIHLGVGTYTETVAPVDPALTAYHELQPDKVWFVHNHPSGNLKASRVDQECMKHMRSIFGDKLQTGIIIDTKSGKYGTFDESWAPKDEGKRNMPESQEGEIPLKVYSFSKQVFDKDWNPETAFDAGTALRVAQFVSSHRLGDHDKMSLIVMNHNYNVTGNIFLPYTRLSQAMTEEGVDLIARYMNQMGGTLVTLYGNYSYLPDEANGKNFSRFQNMLKNRGVRLIDVVHINGESIEEGFTPHYHSYNEYGMIGEPDIDIPVAHDPITDPEEIERLDNEPKEVGYRNVVLNPDGTMGSPMASKLGKTGVERKPTAAFQMGKWEKSEENPDIATDDGKINLIKPDGKSVDNVDYNPYIHIRPTLVNKQFKQAWERPNLVYVRTEYPTSELTSGYKADKAKLSVGKHPWNGGELILSRYDKPMEIVPWEEVAKDWAEEFKNADGIHFDIIPPKLLPILSGIGFNILPPHKGMGKACNEAYEQFKAKRYRQLSPAINDINEKFNKEIGRLTDKSILNLGNPSEPLLAAGIENKPLKLYGTKLIAKLNKHGYKPEDVKDLPIAVHHPIAVFKGSQPDSFAILTELHVKDGNVLVALSTGKNEDVDFNIITSAYGKKDNSVIRWINDGKLLNVDKEKALDYLRLSAPIAATTESKALDSAANVVKDFANPKLSKEKLRNIYAKYVEAADETADLIGGVKVIYESQAPEEETLGWYDPNNNTVHVVLPDHYSVNEVRRTVCHEKLGHEGLVALMGSQEEVDKFGQFVFRSASKALRQRILQKADEEGYDWTDEKRFSKAAQEVLGEIAENGPRTADEFSLWDKVKHYLIKLLNKLNLRIRGLINDHDLSYYILKTGEALKQWNKMTPEQKKDASEEYDILRSRRGRPQKRKDESMAQYLQRLREWERWKIAERQARENNDPMPDAEQINEKWHEHYNRDMDSWRRNSGIPEGQQGLGEFPKRERNETPQEYAARVADYETEADAWRDAPSLFDYLQRANDEYREAYRAWKERYGIQEQENVDLGLYEGDPDSLPHILDPEDLEADAMAEADLAEAVGIDMSTEGAQRHTKLAIIERRKNLESANAEDAIWIHNLVKTINDEAKKQGVKPEELRRNLADIIEGTYFEEVIRDDNGDVISIEDISDQLPIKMTDSLKAILDEIKDWYDYFYHDIEDAGLRNDAGYIPEGYVNHVWSREKSNPEAWKKYVENFQRTKSPNMKERIFDTYRSGESVGLVRKFNDIADILAYYSSSNNQAIANKKFLDDLSFIVVEEKNTDGEVVSVQPLLNSSKPNITVSDRYDMYKVPGVGDVWVLKDIQRAFSNIFGTMRTKDIPEWLTKTGKVYDVVSSTAKKIELSFSAFHMGALTEVAMAQMRPDRALKALGQYIIFDCAKAGTIPAYAHPEDFKFAASHLVQLGATQDYAAADVNAVTEKFREFVRELANSQDVAKKGAGVTVTPIAAALDYINKGMDTVLWNFLHDGLKIACFKMFADQIEKRVVKENLTPEQREQLLDEAGQYVNDTFGGQYWELLNVSPALLKWLRRGFLSPDWLISTQRHFLANFGFGSLYSESSFLNYLRYNADNIKRAFGVDVPRDENRRFRSSNAKKCYILGVCGFFYVMMNAINAFFRRQDEEKVKAMADEMRKENPDYKSPYELAYPDGMKWYDYTMYGNTIGQQTHLFLGRYDDGSEWYARWGKQFREFPELFMGRHGVEFPTPLMERMSGKANPIGRYLMYDLPLTVGMYGYKQPRETQEIAEKYGNTVALLAMTAKKFVPYSVPTQQEKEFKMFDLVMPSQKGFTRYKAIDFFKTYIQAGDMDGVMRTYNASVMNGVDAEACLKAAISTVKATQRKELQDGIVDLQTAMEHFDAAKTSQERKLMKRRIIQYLAEQNYKSFTRDEAREQVEGFLNGNAPADNEINKYVELQTSADVRDEYRLSIIKKQAKKYADEVKTEDNDSRAKKLEDAYSNWLDIYDIIRDADNEIGKLKRQLGKGDNDAELMKEIRQIRKEAQEQVDKIQTP